METLAARPAPYHALLNALNAPERQTLLQAQGRWKEARKVAPTATQRLSCDGAFARLVFRHLKGFDREQQWDVLDSLIPVEVDEIEKGVLQDYAELLDCPDTWMQAVVAHCRPDASLAALAQALVLAEAAESRGRLNDDLKACLGELISAILTIRGYELVENVEFQLADVWVVLRSTLPQVAHAASWILGVRCKQSAA